MKLIVDNRWRVDASHVVDLPMSASAVWGQMRDLRRFITIDPLHQRVRVEQCTAARAIPRQGDALVIEHRLLGIGVDRISRVLRWREGRGYAVSDLSKRGVHVGFPHVCVYDVQPTGERTARLTIAARGRWTATFLPRALVKLWLWWIMRSTAARIEAELLSLALLARRRRVATPPPP